MTYRRRRSAAVGTTLTAAVAMMMTGCSSESGSDFLAICENAQSGLRVSDSTCESVLGAPSATSTATGVVATGSTATGVVATGGVTTGSTGGGSTEAAGSAGGGATAANAVAVQVAGGTGGFGSTGSTSSTGGPEGFGGVLGSGGSGGDGGVYVAVVGTSTQVPCPTGTAGAAEPSGCATEDDGGGSRSHGVVLFRWRYYGKNRTYPAVGAKVTGGTTVYPSGHSVATGGKSVGGRISRNGFGAGHGGSGGYGG